MIRRLIENFNIENLQLFFTNKFSNLSLDKEDYNDYLNDKEFEKYNSLYKLGETTLNGHESIIILSAQTNDALTERSAKKKQYDIAKKILKQEFADLAFFIFHDEDGNFRFSLIQSERKDGQIEYTTHKRFSYYVSKSLSNKTFIEQVGTADFSSLASIVDAFSVEKLNKAFYNELSDWYAWAINIVRFPNDIDDPDDDDKYNTESSIRLITRLIFVWFLKQKKLIPNEFFDEAYIRENLIKNFNPHVKVDLFSKSEEGIYYKAILQNLFFAMLNSPITSESDNTKLERKFKTSRSGYDDNKLMRYKEKFSNPDLFVELANSTVPFLNGGLFDCLDKKDERFYYDGFSEREVVQKSLIIPDYLFFGEEVGKNIDLSEFYGDKKKKKVSARGIIDILKRYNFTVDENTPNDQEVSLDPELLGKVFENLLASYNPETQETARKQTGSFYTPREVVHYMVDESLITHLKRTVGEELEEEYYKLLSYTDQTLNLNQEDKNKIIHSLYNCKVFDPACGSGAFPMGVLQQMVHILNKLDPENKQWKELIINQAIAESKVAYSNVSEEERKELLAEIEESFNEQLNSPDYARKLYLIENCIYGSDIQPIAIQIAKLRFFISLVVDQQTTEDLSNNFGIKPLPNLEAKFVATNTLKKLRKQSNTLFTSEDIVNKKKELSLANHKIFSAKTSKTKRKYREKVKSLREEIAAMLENQGFLDNIEAAQIASWDMFDQNATANFFDTEWMFGLDKGFDIVIGNPPYVQLQKNKGQLSEIYKNDGFKTFARTGDLYSLFYEKGNELLAEGGILCYITSNKWMRAAYGEKTREYFAKQANPLLLIDFGGIKVFEAATVDTNILLFEKAKNRANTATCIIKASKLKDLSAYIKEHATFDAFTSSDAWTILTPIEKSIKQKIEAVGTPLKDWDININYGIKTGCNEAFIIDGTKKDELIAQDPKSAEIIKPLLRGRDIKRYSYEFSDKWLIATFPSLKIEIDNYPVIKQHLLDYGYDKLKQTGEKNARKKTSNKWFEVQDTIAYWQEFEKKKIMYNDISNGLAFTLTNDSIYFNNTVYFMSSDSEDLRYLLGFLNSKIINWYYKTLSVQLGEKAVRLFTIYVKKIPRPKVDIDEKEKIIELIDKMVLSNIEDNSITDSLNMTINEMYNLNQNEIDYINDSI